MLDQHGKEFIKLLEHINPSKHTYEVFSDWLVMASATLYSWKKDNDVENQYLDIAKQYTKEEFNKHAQLLAITVEALEKEEQDFLGEVFTFAELTNDRNGQYFTPYNISRMSADMIIGENFPEHRVCRINDPTCGAGGMLIAAASVMKERGFNYQQNALFVGQDIDARCARMAFIQLSLLGVPAVIYCMNTLTMKEYWHRETIGYHIAGMDSRLRAEALLENIREMEKSAPVQDDEIKEEKQQIYLMNPPYGEAIEETEVEINLPQKELVQGELF
jgi:type I restriction-modification system DNA methylase subunit